MSADVLVRRFASGANDLAVALGPAPRPSTGIVVLGMHRSGTSAITGVLHLMGISVGAADDRMPPDESNVGGYWESGLLTDFQELLLRRLGGSWDAPPPLAEGWERSLSLLPFLGRGRRIVRKVFGTERVWAWKDPRTSLLLPFWQRALRMRVLTVVIHRNPLEVARSLEARDGLTRTQALRLWETYNRALLANARGLPALVVAYEDLVADPLAVARMLHGYLAAHDVVAREIREHDVRHFIDAQLRHSHYDDSDLAREPEIQASQMALVGTLRSLHGEHEALTL